MLEANDYRPVNAESCISEIRETLGEKLPERQLFESYRPDPAWFLRKPEGIHGIMHEMRVMIWQEILTELESETAAHVNREALRWAAATHDIQRVDDSVDPEHGIRAAQWVSENLSGTLPGETLETVIYLNTWHVPYDHKAPEITPELAIFKDADALDRWRLEEQYPGILTFIDVRKLRHDSTKQLLILPAKALYEKSRQSKNSGAEAVLDAAEELRIIRPTSSPSQDSEVPKYMPRHAD